MTKNIVSIPLEEYKELLLKDRPSDNDKLLLNKIIMILKEHLVYTSHDWSSNPMKNVDSENDSECIKEICDLIKYLDFDLYMNIWNEIQTKERERKAQEEKIKQMNLAKELRGENSNE